MPALAAFLGSLLANPAKYLAAIGLFIFKIWATRLAVRLAAIVAVVAAGSGLMATFNTVISPLIAQAFNSPYGQFIGLAFPPIAGTCLAAILTTWTAISTYKLQVRVIRLTANI